MQCVNFIKILGILKDAQIAFDVFLSTESPNSLLTTLCNTTSSLGKRRLEELKQGNEKNIKWRNIQLWRTSPLNYDKRSYNNSVQQLTCFNCSVKQLWTCSILVLWYCNIVASDFCSTAVLWSCVIQIYDSLKENLEALYYQLVVIIITCHPNIR